MAQKKFNAVTDRPRRENPVLEFQTPRLTDDEWDVIQGRVWDLLRYNVIAKNQMDVNLRMWNDLYEGRTPEGKDWPWPDAANLHVPITNELVDSLHARLAKAALGVNPMVLVKPTDSNTALADKCERYYSDFTRRTELEDEISTAIHLAIRDGVGLLKVGWEERKRKAKVRKFQPLLNPDGTSVVDPVKLKPQYEESVEVEELTEYDDVRVVPVELKDFYLIPSHAYTIDRFGSGAAKGCAHRLWLRYDELKRATDGKGRPLYKPEAVEMLRDNAAMERTVSYALLGTTDITIQDQISLVQPYQKDKEFEIFEIYMTWDLDEDGYDEECVFTMAFQWGILLRAEIFPYWHQQRPFIPIIPWKRPRRFYGFSVAHRLEPIQREINTIRNQRVDYVTLAINPPLKVTKAAITRGDLSQAWGPGTRLEVESPDDVTPMQMPPVDPAGWTEENLIRQYAERMIGLYDVQTTRGTGSRKTRDEIGAVQQEGMIRFDYMMKNIQRSIVDLYQMIHKLKIQYMPEQEEFESTQSATGGTGGGIPTAQFQPDQSTPTPGQPQQPGQKETMSRQELTMANIEFRANGDLPVADKEQFRQEAYFLYTLLIQNPLVSNNLAHVHALASTVLQAWERRDGENIIGTVKDAEMLQQQMAQQAAAQAAQGGGMPGGQGPQNQNGQQRQPAGQRGAGGAGRQ